MKGETAQMPIRPMIPPLAIATLGSWIGVLAAEEWSWCAYAGDRIDLLAPLLALALFAGIFLVMSRFGCTSSIWHFVRGGALAFGIGFASATICGMLYWSAWNADVEALKALDLSDEACTAELTGDPAARDYGSVSNAQVRNGNRMMTIRVIWPDGAEQLSAGHAISMKGNISSPKVDDSGRWAHKNGCVATIKASGMQDAGYAPSLQGAVARFRDGAFDRIRALGGDAAGLLAGIMLGNRTLYAGTELEQAFQTTGLAHLMAVSGTHLAIVTMLLMALLSRTPMHRNVRNGILLLMLVAYVALTAFAASALRACIMCAVALLAGMLKRRKSVLSGLALCIFVFLGISPPIAFSLGFQLSVLAVCGLVLFGSLVQAWTGKLLPARMEGIKTSVAATLAATLMTLPVTIIQFAQLPLISPIANILAAPLVTGALSIGLVGILTLGIPILGSFLLHIAALMATWCAWLVRMLADIPGACIPLAGNAELMSVIFACFAIALWIIWPLPKQAEKGPALALCILSAPLILAIASGFGQGVGQPPQSRIVMLDVGQGDSMLIGSLDASILVDTGEDGEALLRQLARQSVTHLDAVVITHKDKDHAGALKELAGVVSVDHVYVHEDLLGKDLEKEVLDAAQWVTRGGAEGIRQGSQLKAGEFTLTILSPQDGGESGNADSLVSLVEFDEGNDGNIEARGLLTADAESEAVRRVVPAAGDIDFLKVAHHGSKNGLTDNQLAVLRPEIALISVGEKNKYGHPTTSTLRQLENVGAKIYRTDRKGAITLGFAKEGISVSTERSGPD